MITTMRANGTKVNKPPPPVPPRPSKNVVAEALAKSRKSDNGLANNNITNGAPPVVKSQSYSAIYKFNNAPKIDRGVVTEEPPKPATRTLIYQSSNISKHQSLPVSQVQPLRNRVSSVEEIRVNVNRKESIKRECRTVTKTSSFKTKPPEVILLPVERTKLEDRDSSLESLGDSEPISRSNSFKTDANNSSDSVISEDEGNWNNDTTDRNHVNTLIDEMFASVLDLPDKPEPVATAVDDCSVGLESPKPPCDVVTIRTAVCKDESNDANDSPTPHHQTNQSNHDSKKTIVVIEPRCELPHQNVPITPTANVNTPANANDVNANNILPKSYKTQRKIDDKFNHELLISELSSMKRDRQIFKRQRNPSENSSSSPSSECKIQHSDWVEVNDGKEIRLSSCQITIADDDEKETKQALDIISRLEMANLHGLPPLPKSLSGFNIEGPPPAPSSIGRPGTNRNPKNPASTNGELGSLKKPSNLDAKLALLRREMVSFS